MRVPGGGGNAWGLYGLTPGRRSDPHLAPPAIPDGQRATVEVALDPPALQRGVEDRGAERAGDVVVARPRRAQPHGRARNECVPAVARQDAQPFERARDARSLHAVETVLALRGDVDKP